jgi:DNA-binding IclR family transcriptional regulator
MDLLESVGKNCKHEFLDERVPSRQTIHNLVNKLRTMGLLIDKNQKHKHWELTEKLHDTGARLEHTPRKSTETSSSRDWSVKV